MFYVLQIMPAGPRLHRSIFFKARDLLTVWYTVKKRFVIMPDRMALRKANYSGTLCKDNSGKKATELDCSSKRVILTVL